MLSFYISKSKGKRTDFTTRKVNGFLFSCLSYPSTHRHSAVEVPDSEQPSSFAPSTSFSVPGCKHSPKPLTLKSLSFSFLVYCCVWISSIPVAVRLTWGYHLLMCFEYKLLVPIISFKLETLVARSHSHFRAWSTSCSHALSLLCLEHTLLALIISVPKAQIALTVKF